MHAEDKEIVHAKEHYLQQLLTAIEENDVDPLIVPALIKLNELPGVITLYSCTGHKDRGSPMPFVYLIISKRKEAILRKHVWPFIKYAPFFLQVEFEYSVDIHICSRMQTRIKFQGEPDNAEEDSLPMFHYIHDFLATIGSDEQLDVELLGQ